MTNIDQSENTALDLDDAPEDAGIQKVDARARVPRRGPRASAAREPSRPAVRSGQVIGRNGEILSRTIPDGGADSFHVPREIVPDGWVYQWNTVTVHGSADVALRHMNTMYANGWRAVPADRHPGRYTAIGHKGDIVVEGLRLEERPIVLTEEAMAQDQRKAMQQMRDRDQALMGGKANFRSALKDGIAVAQRYRGTGADLRMSIDPALDAPAPEYELAQPGE